MKLSEISPYPLTFAPLLKEKVWGGVKLASVLGKAEEAALERPLGESWEVVDLPDGDQSVVAEGPARGARLQELVQAWGEALLGDTPLDGERFPLLVKYIDAGQHLSIQVHPDADTARALGGRPKSEAWYVLQTDPGAVVYLGLQPGTTQEDLVWAIAEGTVEQVVPPVEVRPGDLIPVRPGTVHAIGAGILLAEVQQPSDTTYRVYDWGRVGLRGKPRELHIEQALRSIHFGGEPPPVLRGGRVKVGLFSLELVELAPGAGRSLAGSGPAVVVGLGGAVEVRAEGHSAVPCDLGRVVLLPHVCRRAELRAAAQGDEDPRKVMLVTFSDTP